MARLKTIYRCQSCGFGAAKFLGQCPSCQAWNSLVEEVIEETAASLSSTRGCTRLLTDFTSEVISLGDLKPETAARMSTGLVELDRLLGGGLVRGQVTLLAGPPGIGKSTLVLQAAAHLAASKIDVLYVSGEESLAQISSRAKRLNLDASRLSLLSETDLLKILAAIEKLKPKVLVLDSIQTVYHPELDSSPGTVAQVRECASQILRFSKGSETSVFLLGHVTKDGSVAGPRVLEHIVDTVLYFDSERQDLFRVLRAQKNRFGPTDEAGFFEMGRLGLKEVQALSSLFVNGSHSEAKPGRAISVALEGSRPVLIEVQSLVVSTKYPLPRRMATGLDLNRVLVLLAAMEKHLRLRLEDKDVFLNLAGGVKMSDPALDLAICAAVLSSAKDVPVPADLVAVGEVSLLGEIGNVPRLDQRLKEAAKIGFKRALVAKGKEIRENIPDSLSVSCAADLQQAMRILFGEEN
jgi:DNA repair protein RadA/Sms